MLGHYSYSTVCMYYLTFDAYFFKIQNGEKNIINQNDLFIPFIAGEVGSKEKQNWEVCYTMHKVPWEWLGSIITHSILGDSGAKNRRQQKQWMTNMSHPFFFMADGRISAERCLTRAHCLYFITKNQDWARGARKGYNHLSYESWSSFLQTIIRRHTYRNQSHLCWNRVVVSPYWWLSTGMEWKDRMSSLLKYHTQVYF